MPGSPETWRASTSVSELRPRGTRDPSLALAAVACASGVLLAALASAPTRAASAETATSVTFTTAERQIIGTLRATASQPPDRTNIAAADPNAQEFGCRLFFDKRLSRSGQVACASCHNPADNWTDGLPVSRGEAVGTRKTPTLWNVARRRWYFWDGRADTLWSQALVPIEARTEMGSDRRSVVKLLLADRKLLGLYRGSFGEPPALLRGSPRGGPTPQEGHALNVAFANVGKALAAFESTLTREDAPFDVFAAGLLEGDVQKQAAISDSAKRGLELFLGRGNCILCHTGPEFTDEEFHDDRVPARPLSDSTDLGRYAGLIFLASAEFKASSEYSDDRDDPRAQLSSFQRLREDARGQFRTPSLRNVALTAPYMHAGQLPTLKSVIEFYSHLPPAHDAQGTGETLLGSLNLRSDEVSDLVAFLETLTGAAPQSRPCAARDL
jgi:cytochrome c peroxidase